MLLKPFSDINGGPILDGVSTLATGSRYVDNDDDDDNDDAMLVLVLGI